MRAFIRSATALLRDSRLVMLHLAGNILLLAAAAFWLLIPEAHLWQLLLSAAGGIMILFCFLWLHCYTMARGAGRDQGGVRESCRESVRRLPLFAILAALLVALMHWSNGFTEKSWQISGYFFTRLPHSLQRAFGEWRFHDLIHAKLVTFTWFVLPAVLLPLLAWAASFGLSRRGLGAAVRVYARWRYWAAAIIGALAGIWVPSLLIDWTPATTLTGESISMVLRLLTAYLLAVSSWLMISSVVGGLLRPVAGVESARGNPLG